MLKRFGSASLFLVLAGALAVLPVNGASMVTKATKRTTGGITTSGTSVQGRVMKLVSGDEGVRRLVLTPEVDRAQTENLQRWVAAGHEAWCKDALQVAAEEMRRLAPGFAEGGAALQVVEESTGRTGDGTNVVTFEWAPADGRALYRVTVERFAWLLPIAGDAESIVWVPTGAEIWICEGSTEVEQIHQAGGASPAPAAARNRTRS